MELAPVRLAPWREVDGRVVIERPKPGSVGGVREHLRYWLAVRRIRLDDKGSLAWKLFDGTKTVADVATALREEFGEQVKAALRSHISNVKDRMLDLLAQHGGAL